MQIKLDHFKEAVRCINGYRNWMVEEMSKVEEDKITARVESEERRERIRKTKHLREMIETGSTMA